MNALDALIVAHARGDDLDIGHDDVFDRAEVRLWTLLEARDAAMGSETQEALGKLVQELPLPLGDMARIEMGGYSIKAYNAYYIERAWRETVESLITTVLASASSG